MAEYHYIVSCGGSGDQILAFQCARYVRKNGGYPIIVSFSRPETFEPLNILFKDKYYIIQKDEKDAERIPFLSKQELISLLDIKEPDPEISIVYPDILFKHPLAFNYQKYNTHPQAIRNQRLLKSKWKPEKIIFIALNTSTEVYKYNHIPVLVRFLAEELPDYTIYLNNLTRWNNTPINNNIDMSSLPANAAYFENQSWEESLKWLARSCYCISLCNGVGHMAWQFSMPMTKLSNRLNLNGIMWQTRWLNNMEECISYDYSPREIARLVKTNIRIPQTCLIPRKTVIENLDVDWYNVLGFKF